MKVKLKVDVKVEEVEKWWKVVLLMMQPLEEAEEAEEAEVVEVVE